MGFTIKGVCVVLLALGTCLGQEVPAGVSADSMQQIIKDAKDGVVSDAMTQKLTPEQIVDLVKHIQDRRTEERVANINRHKVQLPGEGMIVPVALFLVIALIVIIPMVLAHRRKRRLYDLIQHMVENGKAVPPELLTPSRKKDSDLKTGVLLVCGGLGVIVALLIVHHAAWGLGFIPLIIGSGYVLVGKLEQGRAAVKRDTDDNFSKDFMEHLDR